MIAEQAVIGAAILGGAASFDECRLTAEEFYDARASKVWSFLAEAFAENRVIDSVIVTSALPQLTSFVYECTSACPSVASAPYYAQQVRDAALKRRLAQIGARTAQEASKGDTEGDSLVESLYRDLDGLKSLRQGEEVSFMFEHIDSLLQYLETKESNSTSGLKPLDDLLNGFRKGALYVIGARPAVGKTVVGLQVALGLSRSKVELPENEQAGSVAFFSLEMSKRELLNRVISQTFDLDIGRIDRKELSAKERELIDKYRHKLTKPLAINDRAGQSLSGIRNYCRAIIRNGGSLKAIVIDYLGLISEANSGRSRYEAMTAVSGALKGMAKDFNVPVIALAQLNRAIENRKDDTPIMADLRDSGSIEQDADVVMLLHRRMGHGSRGSWDLNVMEIAVAKNRHGQTGLLNFNFEGRFSRISPPLAID